MKSEAIVASEWYQRDASWWDSPDTRKPKKWHRMLTTGGPACGLKIVLDQNTYCTGNPPVAGQCKLCRRLEISRE